MSCRRECEVGEIYVCRLPVVLVEIDSARTVSVIQSRVTHREDTVYDEPRRGDAADPTAAANSASPAALDPATERYPTAHQTGHARRDHDRIGRRTGRVLPGRVQCGAPAFRTMADPARIAMLPPAMAITAPAEYPKRCHRPLRWVRRGRSQPQCFRWHSWRRG